MAGDLSTLKSYIDTGDYQTAYNQARAAGFGLNDIASFVNQNYGTQFGATDFSKYEPGSMANLNANNYKYMTYDNGIGQGTPLKIGTMGAGGQTVTGNTPPAAGTYNPNIVPGPVQNNSNPNQFTQPTLPNPNNNNTPTNNNTDLSLGLPALYPRRRADQSFNRGNNYFNMGSGNYQNRFA